MREFSVPASFEVGEHDNIVSSVYSHERDDPDHVIFQRLVDGAWTDVTAAEAASQIRSAALGLIAEGVEPGDRVAVLSATRYEWPILDFAILSVGALTVPIYETSSADQVKFVLGDSGAVLVFAETDAHAEKIEALGGELPDLRKVFRIDGSGSAALDELAEAGKSVDAGDLDARLAGIKAADPATLIYTSGTTGRPKGCQLTHSNLVYEIRGAKAAFPTLLDKGERLLVFLPLAHVLARAHHHRGVREQGDVGLHQRHQEPGADARGVQADAGGVGAPGVREGLQHRRAERAQRRQGPDLRDRRQHRDRVERGAGRRGREERKRAEPAAARQACGVRPTGLRQAARRARRQLPRRDLRWRSAGCAARPLLPRRRADHLRGIRPDRDERGDHRQPGRCCQGRFGRKAVGRQQHALGRRRRAAGPWRRGVRRLLAKRGGDQGGVLRRLVPHRRPRCHRRPTAS